MCAILDANAASAVFGRNQGGAAREFFNWINDGSGSLVVGGMLRDELNQIGSFRKWQQQAILAGRIKNADDAVVDKCAHELARRNVCASNDHHIIALANVTGARLLYTNDRSLQKDFTNRHLLKNPRGKIYTTNVQADFQPVHRSLLTTNTCRDVADQLRVRFGCLARTPPLRRSPNPNK